MKKRKPCILLAGLVMIMALVMMAGCCKKQELDGSVSESFMNCVTAAQELVCKFNTQDSKEAQMAINFISTAAPIAGAVTGVSITQAQAEAILNEVVKAAQTGSCVALDSLQKALAYFDALSAQYSAKMAKAVFKIGVPEVPSVIRLRAKAIGK